MSSINRSMDMDHGEDSFNARRSVSERRVSVGMTPEEERERRASIQEIMQDPDLTPLERRQSIQSLMDGRRRSSNALTSTPGVGMNIVAAAAAAAAEFYDSSDDDEIMQDDSIPNTRSASDAPQHQDTNASSSSESSSLALQQTQYHRLGRSASLKEFAAGAAAAAAACSAATIEVSDNPDDIISISRRMEKSRPPCNHYDRNCTIISPCCGLAFGCRICHDECPVLPAPTNTEDWKSVMDASRVPCEAVVHTTKRRRSLPVTLLEPQLSHHAIDRFAMAEIICRHCYTRQDCKTNSCVSCGIQFGKYHCAKCNLWMSDEEEPYHCEDCGFCRVGGRDNFRHCQDCGMCIDAQLFHNHNCKAGRYTCNCPVCQEDLFSSRSASHEMPCGHAIHWHCFKEFTSYDTKCPVCKKTAETPEHMAPMWAATAMSIALQPVPPEMARVVNIICNDCEARDANRQWHFLGVQCRKCSSFNTSVERITLMGREADGVGVTPTLQPSSSGATDTTGNNNSHNGVSVTMEQRPVNVDDDMRPEIMEE